MGCGLEGGPCCEWSGEVRWCYEVQVSCVMLVLSIGAWAGGADDSKVLIDSNSPENIYQIPSNLVSFK